MHDPMYMVVNLGVGGVAGRPGAAADGAEMKVDYVRAYALDGEEIAKAGDDTILGSAASETLEGGGGNDTVLGFAGEDLLRGGAGDDSLRGDFGLIRSEGGLGRTSERLSCRIGWSEIGNFTVYSVHIKNNE